MLVEKNFFHWVFYQEQKKIGKKNLFQLDMKYWTRGQIDFSWSQGARIFRPFFRCTIYNPSLYSVASTSPFVFGPAHGRWRKKKSESPPQTKQPFPWLRSISGADQGLNTLLYISSICFDLMTRRPGPLSCITVTNQTNREQLFFTPFDFPIISSCFFSN